MSSLKTKSKKELPLKDRLHEIIFEAETFEGRTFDIVLLIAIVVSIITVFIESLPNLTSESKHWLHIIEWVFTIFFSLEYTLRLYTVHKPIKYATSFYGVIDLLSILPTYLSLLFGGTQSLLVIRALRLMRLFRIFKMVPYLAQGNMIAASLKRSIPKILVFIAFVMVAVCIVGAVMYIVEGGYEGTGFDSIPRSIYWAIVTVTTVGYGDIAPQTALGQFLSAILMLTGYAIIAVPTGIVSADIVQAASHPEEDYNTQACRYCSLQGHDADAIRCKYCGEYLHLEDEPKPESNENEE